MSPRPKKAARPSKKAPRRGNFQAAVPAGRRGQHTVSLRSGQESAGDFTLAQEARNTERGQKFWDQRLRDNGVAFIRAGTLEPTELQNTEDKLADMSLNSRSEEAGAQGPADNSNAESEVGGGDDVLEAEEEAETSTTPHFSTSKGLTPSPGGDTTLNFILDTQGTGPVETGIPPPRIRSCSATPSNSSEEVILFGGRDALGRGISRDPKPRISRVVTDPIDLKIKAIGEKIHAQEELLEGVLQEQKTTAFYSQPSAETSWAEASTSPRPPTWGSTRSRKKEESLKRGRESLEDSLIADYIANIQDGDEEEEGNIEAKNTKSFLQCDLGGPEDEIWVEPEATFTKPSGEEKQSFESGWAKSDICDLDDLSTSDGVMGEVIAILSKRERASGIQYLVVWEHQTVDEARWVPIATLTGIIAWSLIEKFEAEEKLVAEFVDNDEADSSDSEDIQDIQDLDDDIDDEADKRKIDKMSDERIARLLAKQEELGMGSEHLVLFDDDDDADEEVEGLTSLQERNPYTIMFSPKRGSDRGSKRTRGEFPSATKMADAYDGFDIMDFERPSLKKRPKGRKGMPVFDLSDSDLAESMQQAWDNDRSKKKERKQEREELRAQGLLGSKTGQVNMKRKYKEGMGIQEAKEEIKIFIIGNKQSLALPPMDKRQRKIIHELANAYKLKSKSVGNGNDRFPVLYKTSRTITSGLAFDAAEAKLSHRFLPRGDVRGNGERYFTASRRGNGGFNNSSVSYKDGDIVGGSAPELGAENKGRAMLEKMGWSSGTALGALNNKGILQPVSHVVKTGKAGLG